MEKRPQVFVSYARPDQDRALEIARELQSAGFNPWLDTESLLPGEDWRASIKRAIRGSDFFLALLSRNSLDSEGLEAEFDYALEIWKEVSENDIFLIPVRLEPCKVPHSLQRLKALDLFGEAGWRRLLRALEAGIKRRRARSPELALAAISIVEIARVTEKLQTATEVPGELALEWKIAVRRFDSISMAVAQYLALHSEYRKGASLEKAMEDLEALRLTLAAANGWLAPRLLKVADEWRRLLKIEQSVFSARVRSMPDIPNPFMFGNPVGETQCSIFTGRHEIVRKIEDSILGAIQAPTLLLHGPRRMGKTSILNQLPRLLGEGFVSVAVDCQNPAVIESARSALSHIAKALFDGMRRHFYDLPSPIISNEQPFADFDSWLDILEKRDLGKVRILLCLDEYERLGRAIERGWGCDLLDALRHLLQHRSKVILMFIGVRTFADLGPEWTDRFISARRIRVSFLGKDEVTPLLLSPIPDFGLSYEGGAIDHLFGVTNGQPFLTQAVAFELVQHVNEQHRKSASRTDVESAVVKALYTAGEYFANVWGDAGAQGQELLQLLAATDLILDLSSYKTEHMQLCKQDVLRGDGKFAVPMVRRWVQQRTSFSGS